MKRRPKKVPKKDIPAAVLRLRDGAIKTRKQASRVAAWLRNTAHFIEANHAMVGTRFRSRYFPSRVLRP